MKRIFMVSSQPLFSRGVENLLSRQGDLEIVGREADPSKAIEQIRRLKPQTVILDSKDPASTPAGLVAVILKEAPDTTVISLNLENDQIWVYRGEQRCAQSIDDLREVIDEEAARPKAISCQEWRALAADRALVYALLAASYSRPVDETWLDRIGDSSLRLIGSLVRDDDLTGDMSEGLRALDRFRAEVFIRPRDAVDADLSREYARLLEDGGPEAETVFACEGAYTGLDPRALRGARAALSQAYAAAGLCPSARAAAQPDFIGAELEFMEHLCACEQAAWRREARSAALAIQALECGFLKEHLIRWVPRCCDALLVHARLDFYRGIVFLTKGFILNEAYRVAELMEAAGPLELKPVGV